MTNITVLDSLYTCGALNRKMHEGSPQHLSNIAWASRFRAGHAVIRHPCSKDQLNLGVCNKSGNSNKSNTSSNRTNS